MSNKLSVVLLVMLASIANIANAKSGFNVCNKSNEKMSVAIGYYKDNNWITEGWWSIPRGECKKLLNSAKNKNYYVRATGVRGSTWGNDAALCVDSNAFTIKGHGNCTSRGYKSEKFNKVDTGDSNNFTYSLTGGKLSKIETLDVGDGVYVQGFFSDELAMIVRIDKPNNKVKVRRQQDGTTVWVSASKIITREESLVNDVGRTIGGAVLFLCLLNPEACKN